MYTPMQENEFRAELSRRRIPQIAIGLLIVVLGLLVMGLPLADDAMLFGFRADSVRWALLLAIGVLAVASMALWRCPACGKHLGSEIKPAKCGHCGVSFSAPRT